MLGAGTAGLALALGGCGFRPLYGRRENGAAASNQLAMVRITPLAGRDGQALHNLLRDRVNPYGQPSAPSYRLDISYVERVRELGIRKDETATRANLTIDADYRLVRLADNKVVDEGRALSVNSYNILDLETEFATEIAIRDARERGLREVADEITTRLAVYFSSQEVKGG